MSEQDIERSKLGRGRDASADSRGEETTWLRPALLFLSYIATLHIPRETLPWLWLLTLAFPAMLLGLFGAQMSRRFGYWRTSIAAALIQGVTLVLALRSGQRVDVLALLCVLLMPMCFWTSARGRVKDVTTVLALSFCLLLTGVLLRDSWSRALLAIYAACVALVLFLERDARLTRGARVRVHGASQHASRARTRAAILCLALAVVALATTIQLAALVRPLEASRAANLDDATRDRRGSGGRSRKNVGVDERFLLESLGNQGSIQQTQETVCFVEATDGEALPLELYLRCAAFEIAGRKEWTRAVSSKRRTRFHRFERQKLRTRSTRIRVLAEIDGLVPVLAGLTEIATPKNVQIEVSPVLVRQIPPFARFVCEQRFAPYLACPEERPEGTASLRAIPLRLQTPEIQRLIDELPDRDTVPSTLDDVAALLEKRCKYVLSDPEGPYDDVLLNFLLTSRRGYCMHFAGAAVLLLRAKGVPCRIATGLVGGVPGSEAAALEQDAPAAWRRSWSQDPAARRAFGSQHAHAWVEIPRRDGAWFVFDPTPAPHRGLERARARATEEALSKEEAENDEGAEAFPAHWLLIALGVLFALLRYVLWRRIEQPSAEPRHALSATPAHGHFERMLELLQRAGLGRAHDESWLAFAARLRKSPRITAQERESFGDAVTCYCALRYGEHTIDAQQEARLVAGLASAQALRAREAAGA